MSPCCLCGHPDMCADIHISKINLKKKKTNPVNHPSPVPHPHGSGSLQHPDCPNTSLPTLLPSLLNVEVTGRDKPETGQAGGRRDSEAWKESKCWQFGDVTNRGSGRRARFLGMCLCVDSTMDSVESSHTCLNALLLRSWNF